MEPIAEALRKRTGASFVVIANRKGIRYAHPDPAKIGRPISTDPAEPLSGKEYVGVQTGSLGRSVRAKVPVVARGRSSGSSRSASSRAGSAASCAATCRCC